MLPEPAIPRTALTFPASGDVTLTPPLVANLPSGYAAYKGIRIIQDRASVASINLSGNGGLTIDGILYAPKAKLNITGNGGLVINTDPTAPVAQAIAYDANIPRIGGRTINVDAITWIHLPAILRPPKAEF